MGSDRVVLEKMIGQALTGKGSHVEAKTAFEALDWKIAGICPEGSPHSIYQLLNHMIYWQEWAVRWLDGEKPPVPKHAGPGWPGSVAPEGAEDWKQAVRRFGKGLDEMNRRSRETDLVSKQGGKTRLEMLEAIASHNSYHLGQVVLLRQILGTWPPPSGGLTW
jgi:uncharacterized damage-inducible protein DinB